MEATNRLEALVTWAGMLAQWRALTHGPHEPDAGVELVRAVPDATAAIAATAVLEEAARLGFAVTITTEAGAVFGSSGAPWTALFAFTAMRKAAQLASVPPAELVRLAIDAETRRLFGLSL